MRGKSDLSLITSRKSAPGTPTASYRWNRASVRVNDFGIFPERMVVTGVATVGD
jgi:hypothetical protein